jgi:hypothetical protein
VLLLRAEGPHFARAPISSGCARWQGSVRPPRL